MALSTCLYSCCMPRCLIGGQDYLIFSTSFPSGGPGTGGRDVFIKTLFLILDLSYSFLDFRKNEPEKKGPPLLYLSISTTSSLIFVTCCSKSYRPFEFGSRWLNRFTRAHHSSPFTYLPLRKKKGRKVNLFRPVRVAYTDTMNVFKCFLLSPFFYGGC